MWDGLLQWDNCAGREFAPLYEKSPLLVPADQLCKFRISRVNECGYAFGPSLTVNPCPVSTCDSVVFNWHQQISTLSVKGQQLKWSNNTVSMQSLLEKGFKRGEVVIADINNITTSGECNSARIPLLPCKPHLTLLSDVENNLTFMWTTC